MSQLEHIEVIEKRLWSAADNLLIYKLATRLIDTCEQEGNTKESDTWVSHDITRARKAADEARGLAVAQLKQVRYFWKQAHWLTERFPDAKLHDVEGPVKLVNLKKTEGNDWSLTPGRYVGVAPENVDESFDFEATLREIHVELEVHHSVRGWHSINVFNWTVINLSIGRNWY